MTTRPRTRSRCTTGSRARLRKLPKLPFTVDWQEHQILFTPDNADASKVERVVRYVNMAGGKVVDNRELSQRFELSKNFFNRHASLLHAAGIERDNELEPRQSRGWFRSPDRSPGNDPRGNAQPCGFQPFPHSHRKRWGTLNHAGLRRSPGRTPTGRRGTRPGGTERDQRGNDGRGWHREPSSRCQRGAVQEQILTLAAAKGWAAYFTYDSRRSPPGFPDLVLARDRVIFAELKTLRGRVRPEQLEWLERLRGAGAETYLWRPAHAREIERVLA
jgi:hypothetical protein